MHRLSKDKAIVLLQSLSSFYVSLNFFINQKTKVLKTELKKTQLNNWEKAWQTQWFIYWGKFANITNLLEDQVPTSAHKFSSKFEGDTLVEIYGDMKNLSSGDFGKRVIDAPQVGNHYKTILWSTKITKTGVWITDSIKDGCTVVVRNVYTC